MSALELTLIVTCAALMAVAVSTGNPVAAILAVGCWAMAAEFREPRC